MFAKQCCRIRGFSCWMALKLVVSAAIIGVTYLIIKPSADYEIEYLWWVVSIVGCIAAAMVISHYLPPFLYGYVMINKHYWKIDLELEEISSRPIRLWKSLEELNRIENRYRTISKVFRFSADNAISICLIGDCYLDCVLKIPAFTIQDVHNRILGGAG